MISKTCIETIDGGSSGKAGSSLLALSAQGETALQGAAGDFFLRELSVSSTYCLHNRLTFSATAVCACVQHFLPEQATLGNAERAKEPWHEVDRGPGSCLCPVRHPGM